MAAVATDCSFSNAAKPSSPLASPIMSSKQLLSMLHNLPLSPSVFQARQAHACFIKSGDFGDEFCSSKLISLYANDQCFDEADLVLRSIRQPSIFSFSTLIYALTSSNHFAHSLRLFCRMLSHGLAPDSRLIPSVVKACGGLSDWKAGKQLHGMILRHGFEFDSIVMSSLVHMYVKCDDFDYAHKAFDGLSERDVVTCSALLSGHARKGSVSEMTQVFHGMKRYGIEPNLVSWNGMISGLNHSRHYHAALILFKEMHSEGLLPDERTVSSALPSVGELEEMKVGIQIHCYVVKRGLLQDKCVISALMDMYGKCGCSLQLHGVFEDMDEKDVVACNAFLTGLFRNGLVNTALETFEQFRAQGMELSVVSWTSVIAGCTQNGRDIEALDLFREMQIAGVQPNAVTLPCLLPACGNISALMRGKTAHCFSLRTEIVDDVYVGSALVDMYAKCGRINLARYVFDRMPFRNKVSWNSIMGGYAMHGKTKEAMEIFHLMQRAGQKPDHISFSCILSACCQGGLTKEGLNYFNSMSLDHGLEPKIEHYACIVNLLGHAGKLQDAYAMMQKMPFKADACVWGALLSSCRLHKNVSMGEIAAKELFQLEPLNPGNYILLSNIYASKGMWREVDLVRDEMMSRGLRKNPGCSWIEIKNQVHMLLAGDKSHPQMDQVIEKLNKLSVQMKIAGYIPHTDFVLHDVEEQDKELILCGHSEKLAVALGLLNTPPGFSLQVIKNLRICGDCHSVIKFISAFERREIFVRDTNRFHHFRDGVCSCGDHW